MLQRENMSRTQDISCWLKDVKHWPHRRASSNGDRWVPTTTPTFAWLRPAAWDVINEVALRWYWVS